MQMPILSLWHNELHGVNSMMAQLIFDIIMMLTHIRLCIEITSIGICATSFNRRCRPMVDPALTSSCIDSYIYETSIYKYQLGTSTTSAMLQMSLATCLQIRALSNGGRYTYQPWKLYSMLKVVLHGSEIRRKNSGSFISHLNRFASYGGAY